MSERSRRFVALLVALAALFALARPAAASAAPYVDHDGHTVQVLAPGLPPDPARDRAFVEVLGSLLHTGEMGGVSLYLAADQAEIDQQCGGNPYSCLNSTTITIPGWRPASEPSQRIAIAHEYGHIIHSVRANPPRDAFNDGTKRWATYEGICQGLRSGQYGTSYTNTPREAFAHAYATLNFADTPWPFDESLRPDAFALEAIREDVLVPWEATEETIRGRLTRSKKRRTYELALPFDGILSAQLKTSGRLKAKMKLIARDRRPGGRALEYEVCGERSAKLKVSAKRTTRGAFKVKIERA